MHEVYPIYQQHFTVIFNKGECVISGCQARWQLLNLYVYNYIGHAQAIVSVTGVLNIVLKPNNDRNNCLWGQAS